MKNKTKQQFSRWFVCVMMLLPSLTAFSQEGGNDSSYQEVKPNLENRGFSLVDQWPMYPNGEIGINEHIKKELTYPEKALADGIQGQVVVRYVVQTDGSVGEIEVVRSVHPLLDEEAKRVIRAMGKWKPAIQQGKPVRSAYEQEFNFRL